MSSEITTPRLAPPRGLNLGQLLLERTAQAANHVAFLNLASGGEPITTAEFQTLVDQVAGFLVDFGLEPEDRIAVAAPTSYEWAVIDFACWRAGLVVVPIYETSSVAQIERVLQTCEPKAGFAGTKELLAKLREADPQLPTWHIDDIHSFRSRPELQAIVDQRTADVQPSDVATIVHSSGTDGTPSAALITHANLVDVSANVAAAYPSVVHDAASTLIFLPLSHILARGLQVCAIGSGMRISHLSDPKQVIASLDQVQPTFLMLVPRVLEKIRDSAATKAEQAHIGWLYRRAEASAIAAGRAAENAELGQPVKRTLFARIAHRFYDLLFFRRLRKLLGGQINQNLSGAAPLAAELSWQFRGMGIPVLEGYGLTETTAPIAGNRPGAAKSGTVGTPIPGTTIRVSETGEVYAKGPGICAGYLGQPDHLVDGFLPTGDLGRIDKDGYLTITGRVKDVIVTSYGKNINPGSWENEVARSAPIDTAAMVGNGRPYPTAILIREAEIPWPGIVVTDSRILRECQAAVDAANLGLSAAEQVKRFIVVEADLSSFTTPTQKLRKQDLLASSDHLLTELYEGH